MKNQKNITDERTDERTNGVTWSLLELLIAAKNTCLNKKKILYQTLVFQAFVIVRKSEKKILNRLTYSET